MIAPGEQELRVRQFLLGQLDESEQQRVEETVMVDANFREQVLLAEESLIEDYVDGLLPPPDRKAFETYFAAAVSQRQKVKVARFLNRHALTAAPPAEATAAAGTLRSPRSRIGPARRSRALLLTCVAAASVVIIGFGVFQGLRLWRETQQQIEARQKKFEIERELTQLSTTPAQDVKASTFALALAPVVPRDVNESATLPLPSPAEIVEVRLILSQNTYPRYRVDLNRIGGAETYRIRELNAQQTANGEAVVVRIPARLLTPGDYRLVLFAEGTTIVAGEYVFHVSSQ